jgi:hypothetical protein
LPGGIQLEKRIETWGHSVKETKSNPKEYYAMIKTVEVRILKDGVEQTVHLPIADHANPSGFLVDFPQDLTPCTILSVNGMPVPTTKEAEDILNAEIISE